MATTSPMVLHVARNVAHFEIDHAHGDAGNRPSGASPAGAIARHRLHKTSPLERDEVSTGAVSVKP